VSVVLCVEVTLTIPDNEAETALETLQRLGVPLAGLQRADLYRFELEPEAEEGLLKTLRGLETIFNPNKHALRVRESSAPQRGEVWVDEVHPAGPPAAGDVRIAGRTLAGVVAVERFTAWLALGADGGPASPETLSRATETLLCNPAFQRAIPA